MYLSLHLANTLLMLAALALTAHFLSSGPAASRYLTRLRQLTVILLGLGATLIVGVTGSLAALGDTLFPAQTLAAAVQQDFAPHVNWLIRVRILHPLSALVAAVFIVWLVYRAAISRSHLSVSRGLVLSVVGLLLFQMLLGVVDVSLLAPVWMQVLHLFGADLLWVSMVVLSAQLAVEPQHSLEA